MVKKSRVFWTVFLILAIFLISGCGKRKSTEPEPSHTWTILGYFNGNNDQDKEAVNGDTLSYVIQDALEMEQVGSTQDVRIIVMLGSFKTEGKCYYYLIKKHLDEPSDLDSIRSEVLDSLDEEDMSDPLTLRDFIRYGVEHYPADYYLLIINDHGEGWKGVCYDQQNGDGRMMSLPELSSALSGYNFKIIIFGASSMSMAEVAYQLKDRADYLVASQYFGFKRNILGFPIWLGSLTENPNMNVTSLARRIAMAIHTSAVDRNEEVSISAIDLSKVDALTSKIADFGSVLLTHTGDHWKEVVDARETEITSSQFHFTGYYFDLNKFCQNIRSSANLDLVVKSTAQMVEDANDAAVFTTLSTQEELGYGGLCIHFPFKTEDFDSSDYVQLDFAVSGWHNFLSEFINAYADANTGSLRIVSEPVKGASIYLNGEPTGLVTDTTIHKLPAGVYLVKLVKEGYKDAIKGPLEVVAGTTRDVMIGLIPLSPPTESEFGLYSTKATDF